MSDCDWIEYPLDFEAWWNSSDRLYWYDLEKKGEYWQKQLAYAAWKAAQEQDDE